jgi:hypothetical protein
MNNKVLIITGSDGAAAQGLIHYFADKYEHVIGFSRQQQVSYQQESVEIMKESLGGCAIAPSNNEYLIIHPQISHCLNV